MLKERFIKNPVGFIKRAVYKTLIGPLKYRRGNDYNAPQFWYDRFSRYRLDIKGAGDEGLSDEENKRMYEEGGRVFTDLCQKEGFDFSRIKVLEIGCGSGFYTDIFRKLGVKDYTGLDITDVLFPDLTKRYPLFKFIKRDITSDRVDGEFDLVVMIDVIQHIVTEERLSYAMDNVKRCLAPKGVFMVAPVRNVSRKHLFYVRSWSLDDMKKRFPGYTFDELIPFRSGYMLIVRKP